MTATIHFFPSLAKIDEDEFDRKEGNNFTRHLDAGWEFWGAVQTKANHAVVAPRLYAFAAGIARMATYRDELPLLPVGDGPPTPLLDLPAILLNMVGLTMEEARALSHSADIYRLFPVAQAA